MNLLLPGSVFAGSFRVVQPLRAGAMGSVYIVEQLGTGHARALKVMHPGLAQDPRARERFAQEAQIGARIQSDHVVQVVAAGIDPATGTPWLAMELLRGMNLLDFVRHRGFLPPSELLEVFRQLCHALGAAHSAGVVHRDIKPENIFVSEARRSDAVFTVKVLDFGIAKWLQENPSAAASTASIGSPLWMAPEQLDPRAYIGPATDLWPLGLLAFFLLTGRHYWYSANHEPFVIAGLLNEIGILPIDPASARARSLGCEARLPAGFDPWFSRCVARDSKGRFQSADELLGGLAPLLQRPSGAAPAPHLDRTVAMQLPPQPLASSSVQSNPELGSVAPTLWMSAMNPGSLPSAAQQSPLYPYGNAAMPNATMQPRVYPPRGTGQAHSTGSFTPWIVGGVLLSLTLVTLAAGAFYLHDDSPQSSVSNIIPPSSPAPNVPSVSPPEFQSPSVANVPLVPPPIAPAPRPPVLLHACVGTWSGTIVESTGGSGTVTVTLSEPRGGACGSWIERWNRSGHVCRYRLIQCTSSAGRVVSPGVASGSGCVPRVSASMSCVGDRASFRESSYSRSAGNVTDSASLRRR